MIFVSWTSKQPFWWHVYGGQTQCNWTMRRSQRKQLHAYNWCKFSNTNTCLNKVKRGTMVQTQKNNNNESATKREAIVFCCQSVVQISTDANQEKHASEKRYINCHDSGSALPGAEWFKTPCRSLCQNSLRWITRDCLPLVVEASTVITV